MIEKIIAFVLVLVGTWAIIKYLVPYLGAFSSIATIIIALLGILIAIGILANYDFRGFLNR